MQCRYCNTETNSPNYNVCTDCEDIINEHNDNIEQGICLRCNGRCEEMDGTICTSCNGKGMN